MAWAMKERTDSALHIINLSANQIEDKGDDASALYGKCCGGETYL